MKIIWVLRACLYSIFFKKIGWLSYLGRPLYLKGISRISLGRKVRIYPFFRIEVVKKYLEAQVIIEDDVSIGQNLHLISGGNLTIGKGTLVSSNVLITNIDHEFSDINKSVTEQGLIIKDTIIGENNFLGFGCTILPGTSLGRHCVVGANSVVRGKFEDYSVIAGNPAKLIKKYDNRSKSWIKA